MEVMDFIDDIEDVVGTAKAEPAASAVFFKEEEEEMKKIGGLNNRNARACVKPSTVAETSGNGAVPGVGSVWVRTFGCSHNVSDSEYMSGVLASYGYEVLDERDEDAALQASCWVINSCTVKGPSEASVARLLRRAESHNVPVVVAGCVPQGDKRSSMLRRVSTLGVKQISKVVYAVEETMKGNVVSMLSSSGALPSLALPKLRRNKHIEIVPLSTGCLGACTYCKTKHARGELGSYALEELEQRVASCARDPDCVEVWLSSEDTGAYGIDIGSSIVELLDRLVAAIETNDPDGKTMLRIGMTNPPFILDHLQGIARIMHHPRVFRYLHVPVQSASDAVLHAMRRDYTIAEFVRVVDTLRELVPEIELVTDIIAGFPGETDEDWTQTMALVRDKVFQRVHTSQFFPRPGTPAARMRPQVQGRVKKNRTRELTVLNESHDHVYDYLLGTVQKVWVVDRAPDGVKLVGHTKSYVQVLLPDVAGLLGTVAHAKIVSSSRWSVDGELVSGAVDAEPVSSSASTSSSPSSAAAVASLLAIRNDCREEEKDDDNTNNRASTPGDDDMENSVHSDATSATGSLRKMVPATQNEALRAAGGVSSSRARIRRKDAEKTEEDGGDRATTMATSVYEKSLMVIIAVLVAAIAAVMFGNGWS